MVTTSTIVFGQYDTICVLGTLKGLLPPTLINKHELTTRIALIHLWNGHTLPTDENFLHLAIGHTLFNALERMPLACWMLGIDRIGGNLSNLSLLVKLSRENSF
jgi:hypothetical protein